MIEKHKFYKKIKPKTDPRVIAGKIKGKKIECPPGEIRPMTARVKKALFDIIGDCLGMNMLDLFTGSGNISIEAYSRGIESSDLIDIDWIKKKTLEKNIKNAGFEKATLIFSDVLLFCNRANKKYDFIMVDPPFKWDKKEELLRIIGERDLLSDSGFLVIHLTKKEELDEKIGNLLRYDYRRYGLNVLMFYKKDKETD